MQGYTVPAGPTVAVSAGQQVTGVSLVAQKAGSIFGAVTDAATGAALSAAEVRALASDGTEYPASPARPAPTRDTSSTVFRPAPIHLS